MRRYLGRHGGCENRQSLLVDVVVTRIKDRHAPPLWEVPRVEVRVMREDTPLRVSRRTEDTPKIHRRFTYAGSAPKRCIFIRRYTGSRSKRCIFTERVHSEDTRKRERQLLMPLEGLGPPFEGPNGIMFRAGFWKGKPVVLRMSSASSTGYENVFQQGAARSATVPLSPSSSGSARRLSATCPTRTARQPRRRPPSWPTTTSTGRSCRRLQLASLAAPRRCAPEPAPILAALSPPSLGCRRWRQSGRPRRRASRPGGRRGRRSRPRRRSLHSLLSRVPVCRVCR